jgi:CRP/FNR family transcriptional regulator, transcriptional activator FtrB
LLTFAAKIRRLEKAVRQTDWKQIRALPLFSDMSEANFEKLVGAAFLQRFPLHTILINEGELPDFLHIVVEGSVEMFCTHNGHETTIEIMRPVTTFILAAVIRDEVYLKSARTLSPAQILMIPAQTVRDVFDRDAAFARAIVSELADRYRAVVRSLKNEKLRTSAERLANWILKANHQQGDHQRVELAFDKRTLASRLGMTPENLSRNLALLAKYGVSSSGREIVIQDSSALERFAKPNTLIDG